MLPITFHALQVYPLSKPRFHNRHEYKGHATLLMHSPAKNPKASKGNSKACRKLGPERTQSIKPCRTERAARLNLHLLQSVLPDDNVGGDAVLAVVEEDDHAVGVHGLADQEFVVFEVGDNLLGVGTTVGKCELRFLGKVQTQAFAPVGYGEVAQWHLHSHGDPVFGAGKE
jgi:hypothetical protein